MSFDRLAWHYRWMETVLAGFRLRRRRTFSQGLVQADWWQRGGCQSVAHTALPEASGLKCRSRGDTLRSRK